MSHLKPISAQLDQQSMQPLDDEKFHFACHSSLGCFTHCCADLNLALTPYDVLRLKSRLAILSGAFLEHYTTDEIKYNSGLPVLLLKMTDDSRRTCPYLLPHGCSVYEDRPGACRLYPVGRAAKYLGGNLQEHYFLVKESHCLGFSESREWTVQEWLEDQGLEVYHEMNTLWMTINQDPDRKQPLSAPTGDKLRMYFMACYNLDQFRRFVFESRFLQMFQIDKETAARIKGDEVELLKLAFSWVQFSVFGKKTMKIKPAVLEAKKRALARR